MKTMAESLEKASKCTFELRLFCHTYWPLVKIWCAKVFLYKKIYIHIQENKANQSRLFIENDENVQNMLWCKFFC